MALVIVDGFSPIRKCCSKSILVAKCTNSKSEPENSNLKKQIPNNAEIGSSNVALEIDPKRFFAYTTLAAILAIGSNFLGLTTAILSSSAPAIQAQYSAAGLDEIYPISGFKKYYSRDNGYEYLYPGDWLADQTVLLANIRLKELPEDLRSRKMTRMGPDSAFGPVGGDGRLNLSVIKNNVAPGFSLASTLGAPQAAAEYLLSRAIAPPGSGKETHLISASEKSFSGTNIPAYVFEYTVRKGDSFYQHSISIIASRNDDLYTFTAVSPESSWKEVDHMLYASANSFRLK
jgi:hypothetical protein